LCSLAHHQQLKLKTGAHQSTIAHHRTTFAPDSPAKKLWRVIKNAKIKFTHQLFAMLTVSSHDSK